jgi:glutamate decarboxylase
MPIPHPKFSHHTRPADVEANPLFSRGGLSSAPRWRLADKEMLPETAAQIVHDEMMLDGNSRQNLATFVGTWMDPYAAAIYALSADKNMIDKDEYPQTADIEDRCIHIMADLWNSPEPHTTIGVSTIGSSEACMLGGLTFKRRWQQKRRAEGKATDKPNIIMSAAVQVVWEKFANYWDVEPRYVPVTLDEPAMTGEGVLKLVDENTIGVVVIMGVTFTGIYEPVKEIAEALDGYQQETGIDIPIHVDGASGGMVTPFLQPDLEWDFRLERVHSISTSAHKYGLVYPGLGWVVWRKAEYVPEDLIFRVSYLGGNMPTFALNFSRPGAQVLLQYYLFLRLGRDGYYNVQKASQDVALFLSGEVAKLDAFELLSDGSDIPVFAWRIKPDFTQNWDLYDLSDRLREKGWQVPAYPMPENIQDISVMRVVVRNGFSMDLAHLFLKDLKASVEYLERLNGPLPKEEDAPHAFTH